MGVVTFDSLGHATVKVSDEEEAELDVLLAAVQKAAAGDSNDDEIEALQGALEYALGLLRFVWPEEVV